VANVKHLEPPLADQSWIHKEIRSSLNSLSKRLLPFGLMLCSRKKTAQNYILTVVLYGWETWSLTGVWKQEKEDIWT